MATFGDISLKYQGAVHNSIEANNKAKNTVFTIN